MTAKLKPSVKEYVKDDRGRMTSKFAWKHYTPSATSTEELKKLLVSPSYKKKKNIILRELAKRK